MPVPIPPGGGWYAARMPETLKRPRYAYLLPAVAMMLGWGLRGFIGGGPLGAMIPGAMVVLTLCLLYPRRDVHTLIAFGALGVAFGGEMTYGQTVGFIVRAEMFWWGFLGLALKGAIWGALAGAVIGLGFTPMPRLVRGGALAMCAACWAGWKLINEPKLIYFSNRYDKPREEVWAGFALAAVALVVWLMWQKRPQPAVRFSGAGFVGGGIGFGLGGAIHGVCQMYVPQLPLHSWKYMEFFFGFCFGWALAWAWRRALPDLPPEPADAGAGDPPAWVEMAGAVVAFAAIYWLEEGLPLRFAFLVTGSAVLVLMRSRGWLGRQVALTVTFTTAAFDLARHWNTVYKSAEPYAAYFPAVAMGLLFAWAAHRYRNEAVRLLDLLTWCCTGLATVKFAVHPGGPVNVVDHVAIAFILMAAAVSWMARR